MVVQPHREAGELTSMEDERDRRWHQLAKSNAAGDQNKVNGRQERMRTAPIGPLCLRALHKNIMKKIPVSRQTLSRHKDKHFAKIPSNDYKVVGALSSQSLTWTFWMLLDLTFFFYITFLFIWCHSGSVKTPLMSILCDSSSTSSAPPSFLSSLPLIDFFSELSPPTWPFSVTVIIRRRPLH